MTLSTLQAIWAAHRSKSDFVRCPCQECGGMVSIRQAMFPDSHGRWFCCKESRELWQPIVFSGNGTSREPRQPASPRPRTGHFPLHWPARKVAH